MEIASNPQLEQALRQGFRYFNRFMLLVWRTGLGPWLNAWPAVFGRYMVLTHTGRKTGARRRTPVNYASVDGDLYCVAGFGRIADWYRNLIANPAVEVWLPDGWWNGTAEEVVDPPARLRLLRQVLIDSGFAAYASGLDPRGMTDEQLDRATGAYRLMRIRRASPRTGPGGPGDLAWVWPAAAHLLLAALVLQSMRRKRPKG
jgi:deazaflavin-dependent oxidoreductase (nitroreductase family)